MFPKIICPVFAFSFLTLVVGFGQVDITYLNGTWYLEKGSVNYLHFGKQAIFIADDFNNAVKTRTELSFVRDKLIYKQIRISEVQKESITTRVFDWKLDTSIVAIQSDWLQYMKVEEIYIEKLNSTELILQLK